MGTQIYEPPPGDPEKPPPILAQYLLDPEFAIAEGVGGNPWFYLGTMDWDNGFAVNYQDGLGQAGTLQQATAFGIIGEEYTAIITISDINSDSGVGKGADMRWGTFDTGDITEPGVYAFNFIAGGVLDRFLIHAPDYVDSPVWISIPRVYLWNQGGADYFWINNSMGLNKITFYEMEDFGAGELMYRFANKADATNCLIKIEP